MFNLFGKPTKRKTSSKSKKPLKSLLNSAEKHGVRKTRTVNGKRVYKESSMLKKQIKSAAKRKSNK